MPLRQCVRAPTGMPMFAEGVKNKPITKLPPQVDRMRAPAHENPLVVVYKSESVRACFTSLASDRCSIPSLFSSKYVQVLVLTFITDWYRGTFSRSLNVNQTATGFVSFIAGGMKSREGIRGVCGCVHSQKEVRSSRRWQSQACRY